MRAKKGTRMAAATEPLLVPWYWFEGSSPEPRGSGRQEGLKCAVTVPDLSKAMCMINFISDHKLCEKQGFPFRWNLTDTLSGDSMSILMTNIQKLPGNSLPTAEGAVTEPPGADLREMKGTRHPLFE